MMTETESESTSQPTISEHAIPRIEYRERYHINGVELTPTQLNWIDAQIERVREDELANRPESSMQSVPDAYSITEMRRDYLAGRDADKNGYWRKVMEYWGYTWLEPAQIDELIGPMSYRPRTLPDLGGNPLHDALGRPIANSRNHIPVYHSVGQWRDVPGARRRPPLAMRGLAYEMQDLIGGFREPEIFDEWARDRVRAHALRRKRRRF